jgi:xanthine dehydrogenase YagT iron-sulfur-binding subunit
MNDDRFRSRIELDVNGEQHPVEVEHRDTLLDVLRDELDLTGAKRACDRGECGACAVLVDERPMLACQLLAMQVRRNSITTVEGLGQRPQFLRLVDAFVAEDGGQCGYCIPGFAVAAYAALQSQPGPIEEQLLRWELVGHICRCNAYDHIVAAVRRASEG